MSSLPRTRPEPFRRFLLAALSLVVGCRAYQAAPLSQRAAHSRANRQTHRGLSIAAEPYKDRQTVGLFFGDDLWDAGFFPVVLYLENRGPETFEIRRGSASIWLEPTWSADDDASSDSLRLHPVPPLEVVEACQRSVGAAFLLTPLLVFPALWVRNAAIAYNHDLARDHLGKALPVYSRLESGDVQVVGVLFFRHSGHTERLREVLKTAELHVDADLEGSQASDDSREIGDTIAFVISLSDSEY